MTGSTNISYEQSLHKLSDMEERGGLFHRPPRHSLPLSTTEANPNNMRPNASTRKHPAGAMAGNSSRNAAKILLAIAAIALLLAIGIFAAWIPHKAFLISSAKEPTSIELAEQKTASCPHGNERTWHGGHPAEDRPGSCWCGGDEYCMCTPSLAIDIVLYSKNPSTDDYNVWVVRRSDTGQLATIGGFVDVGETTEAAVLREAEEETGIIIPPEFADSAMKLIGVYSDPRRDNRRAIVSVAYALEFLPTAMTTKDGTNVPKAGDDAKEVLSVPLSEIGVKYAGGDWYADHLTILLDFKKQKVNVDNLSERDGELADVARSTCSSL
mmetsp:Transcript_5445/g.11829  ORF Transcript_5445/g.11829 Transcript_5445/m.11829 type:complete len:325 (+) Transcript_5445:1-975(+)